MTQSMGRQQIGEVDAANVSPRFVITLTDEEFERLSDRSSHLEETLCVRPGQYVRLIIQRVGD